MFSRENMTKAQIHIPGESMKAWKSTAQEKRWGWYVEICIMCMDPRNTYVCLRYFKQIYIALPLTTSKQYFFVLFCFVVVVFVLVGKNPFGHQGEGLRLISILLYSSFPGFHSSCSISSQSIHLIPQVFHGSHRASARVASSNSIYCFDYVPRDFIIFLYTHCMEGLL